MTDTLIKSIYRGIKKNKSSISIILLIFVGNKDVNTFNSVAATNEKCSALIDQREAVLKPTANGHVYKTELSTSFL
jgi:hypothetical protein